MTLVIQYPQRYGVEIETVRRSRRDVALAVQQVVGGEIHRSGDSYDSYFVIERGDDAPRWRIMRDGSLSGDSSQQAEVVTPPMPHDSHERLAHVVRAVKSSGAVVDSSCGLHVHIESGKMTEGHLCNLAGIIYAYEPHLYRAFGVSERRKSRYVRPIDERFISRIANRPPLSMSELARVWYDGEPDTRSHYQETRYRGLNFHSVFYRGTVELRYFNGSLHAGRIVACVHLAQALVSKAIAMGPSAPWPRKRALRSGRLLADLEEFLSLIGLDDDHAASRRHLLAMFEESVAANPAEDTSPAPSPEPVEVRAEQRPRVRSIPVPASPPRAESRTNERPASMPGLHDLERAFRDSPFAVEPATRTSAEDVRLSGVRGTMYVDPTGPAPTPTAEWRYTTSGDAADLFEDEF
jgi:hypothetical protein